MMRIVRRDSSTAADHAARSPRISVTSAASIATSVPVPIAMPDVGLRPARARR